MKYEHEDLKEYHQEHHERWGFRTVLLYFGLALTGLPLVMTTLFTLATMFRMPRWWNGFLLLPRSLFVGTDLSIGCHSHSSLYAPWGGHDAAYARAISEPLVFSGILIILVGGLWTRDRLRHPGLLLRRAIAFGVDLLVVYLPLRIIFNTFVGTRGYGASPRVEIPDMFLPVYGHAYLPIMIAVWLFCMRDWRFWIRPGRLLSGTRAIDLSGRPCSLIQSILRNLLLVVPVVPWFAAHQLLRGRPSRLGERMSNTRVVTRKMYEEIQKRRREAARSA